MNVIAQLVFELAYNDSFVQHFNHYTTRTFLMYPGKICQQIGNVKPREQILKFVAESMQEITRTVKRYAQYLKHFVINALHLAGIEVVLFFNVDTWLSIHIGI